MKLYEEIDLFSNEPLWLIDYVILKKNIVLVTMQYCSINEE